MKRLVLFFAATVLACSAETQPLAVLTPAAIDEAIALGAQNPKLGAYVFLGKPAWTEADITPDILSGFVITVRVTTPFLRVAMASAEAHRKGRQFTRADVSDALIRPVIHVASAGFLPHSRAGHSMVKRPVSLLVIAAGDASTVIQPLQLKQVREVIDARSDTAVMAVEAEFGIDALKAGNEFQITYEWEGTVQTGSVLVDKASLKNVK